MSTPSSRSTSSTRSTRSSDIMRDTKNRDSSPRPDPIKAMAETTRRLGQLGLGTARDRPSPPSRNDQSPTPTPKRRRTDEKPPGDAAAPSPQRGGTPVRSNTPSHQGSSSPLSSLASKTPSRDVSPANSPPRPPPAGAGPAGIHNVRFLDQNRAQHHDTPEILPGTTKFKLLSYAAVFAMELLESRPGKAALVTTIQSIVKAGIKDRRGSKRAEWAFQGTVEEVPALVDQFLATLRANFPNVVVSSRVLTTGQALRYSWKDYLGSEAYNPKFAVLVRLNEKMVDAAVAAAEAVSRRTPKADPRNVTKLEALLFVLGLNLAHELVHVAVGRVMGGEDLNTPRKVKPDTTVPGRKDTMRTADGSVEEFGEAGDTWERLCFKDARIEPYQNADDPLYHTTDLYCCINTDKTRILAPDWVSDALCFDFKPLKMLGKDFKIKLNAKSMVSTWIPTRNIDDPQTEVASYFERIDKLPKHNITGETLRRVRAVPQDARNSLASAA